jgi:hypothetical protein
MELGTKKSQLSNSAFGLGLFDRARWQANLVTICSLILEPHATVCCLFKHVHIRNLLWKKGYYPYVAMEKQCKRWVLGASGSALFEDILSLIYWRTTMSCWLEV